MESLFDGGFALEMPDSSESTGLQPTKEGNQASAPGFQPSGGIASTTRALTHAGRSQCLAKHKGEDRATADLREDRKAYIRAYQKKWKAANKAQQNAYMRRWNAANREKRLRYNRKYYAANKEKQLMQKRKYRAANKEKYNEYMKMYQRKLVARREFQQKGDELTDTTVSMLA